MNNRTDWAFVLQAILYCVVMAILTYTVINDKAGDLASFLMLSAH